jgi:hypothetical protein
MTDTEMSLLVLAALVAFAAIGGLVGASRGRTVFGVFMGFLLGPVGWFITALMGSALSCPCCKGKIQKAARVCPHCRTILEPPEPRVSLL